MSTVIRGFDFARKMVDGKPAFEPDEMNCYGEVLQFPTAQLPEYQTEKSAGADFFCAVDTVVPSIWKEVIKCIIPSNFISDNDDIVDVKHKYDIKPTIVHTGIKASMLDDEVLELYNRSSNPKKLGLILANSVGVVDADYFENPDNDGEIMFAFYNIKPWDTKLKVGDRIGQGVFKKFLRPEIGLRIKHVSRVGGIGSTDN